MATLTNIIGTQTYTIVAQNTWEKALEASTYPRRVRIEHTSVLTTSAGIMQWKAVTSGTPNGIGKAIGGSLVPATVTNALTYAEHYGTEEIWVKTPSGGGTPNVLITVSALAGDMLPVE